MTAHLTQTFNMCMTKEQAYYHNTHTLETSNITNQTKLIACIPLFCIQQLQIHHTYQNTQKHHTCTHQTKHNNRTHTTTVTTYMRTSQMNRLIQATIDTSEESQTKAQRCTLAQLRANK